MPFVNPHVIINYVLRLTSTLIDSLKPGGVQLSKLYRMCQLNGPTDVMFCGSIILFKKLLLTVSYFGLDIL